MLVILLSAYLVGLDEVPSWGAVDLISRCVPRIYLCALVHVYSLHISLLACPLPSVSYRCLRDTGGWGSRGNTWNGLMWWDVLQRAGKLGSACHPGVMAREWRGALCSLFSRRSPSTFPLLFIISSNLKTHHCTRWCNMSLSSTDPAVSTLSLSLFGPEPLICGAWSVHVFLW